MPTRRLFFHPALVRHLCLWAILPAVVPAPVRAHEPATAASDTATIRALVDDLRARLEIPQEVDVVLVASNPLMASVERRPGHADAFVLTIERGFLGRLDADELSAVLAHELGHVWIFTHHPYLQTEQLANHVARRLVGRDLLQRVYEKVWQQGGAKGDLTGFLGLAPDPTPLPVRHVAAPR